MADEYTFAGTGPTFEVCFTAGMDQKGQSKTFADYMLDYWTREQIVEFCLTMLGEEARAWWNRRKEHQE